MVLQNKNNGYYQEQENANNRSFSPNPGFEFTSSSGPMGTPTHKRVASQLPTYNTFWVLGLEAKSSKGSLLLSYSLFFTLRYETWARRRTSVKQTSNLISHLILGFVT